jgi:hypothetical protein
MKTKHTKVGLSLLVIVTALTFGMGGANAKAEDYSINKTISENKLYLDVQDSFNSTQVAQSQAWIKIVNDNVTVENISLSEGQEFSISQHYTELLTTIGVDDGWLNIGGLKREGMVSITVTQFGVTQMHRMMRKYVTSQRKYNWVIISESGGFKYFGNNAWPIKGPAEIKIEIRPYIIVAKDDKGWHANVVVQHWRSIYTIKKSSYAQPSNQLQALVLPKNTKNTRLIVESSEDLVNWAIDTPGPKTTTNRERFFRLRAVKE